jgi:hypothetical protein
VARGDRRLLRRPGGVWLAAILGLAPAAARAQAPPPAAAATVGTAEGTDPVADGALRVFAVPKGAVDSTGPRPGPATLSQAPDDEPAARLRSRRDVLTTSIGVGYVQGADWGSEIQSTGAAAGLQIDVSALITKGPRGFVYDHGSFLAHDPDARWRVEAGDLSSSIRGAVEGIRLAWQAAGGRQPAVAVYGSRSGLTTGPAVVTYRDQLRFGDETFLDGEVASDRSMFLQSVLAAGRRLAVQLAYRHDVPRLATDRGLDVTVGLARYGGRGLDLTATAHQLDERGDRTTVSTIGLRVPVSHALNVTVERTMAITPNGTLTSGSAAATISAGRLNLQHRYQYGSYRPAAFDLSDAGSREAFQSAASYTQGARLNVALQLASQWRSDGLLDQWEQLETTMKLTQRTRLILTTAFPRVTDPSHLHVRLEQELGRAYSIEVQYGQLSNFQALPLETERPRFLVMLRKAIAVSTPRRGGDLRGRVVDQIGRPVAGARVTLGDDFTDSGPDGAFHFAQVPTGHYRLSLAEDRLPADYAWDGRGAELTMTSSSRLVSDLRVAPLNAIHGRVYCDRNANGRFDAGEGVAGAVLRLGDHVTVTDADGAYSFYNLWPGTLTVTLDDAHLPTDVAAGASSELTVVLDDTKPVTGADFVVVAKTKPVTWKEIKR